MIKIYKIPNNVAGRLPAHDSITGYFHDKPTGGVYTHLLVSTNRPIEEAFDEIYCFLYRQGEEDYFFDILEWFPPDNEIEEHPAEDYIRNSKYINKDLAMESDFQWKHFKEVKLIHQSYLNNELEEVLDLEPLHLVQKQLTSSNTILRNQIKYFLNLE